MQMRKQITMAKRVSNIYTYIQKKTVYRTIGSTIVSELKPLGNNIMMDKDKDIAKNLLSTKVEFSTVWQWLQLAIVLAIV